MFDDDAVIALKAQMRAAAILRRKAVGNEERARAASAVAALDLGFLGPLQGVEVSGYSALASEFDPGALLDYLTARGARLSLPRISIDRTSIVFRRWVAGDETEAGVWGIREPLADATAVEPYVVLMPLLAFDRHGWRLGYGGGYYDRALAQLRARAPTIAVGLAFAWQEVEAVPHADYDQRLDWVLTEDGAINMTG